jgi:hypothetical protein
MTRHEALAVAVRLFAIGLVLFTVRAFPGSLFALSYVQADESWRIGALLVVDAVVILVAVALWKFPFGIASLLLPRTESYPSLPWTQESAISTASIVIGLFYLTYAFSDLLYWFVFVVAASNSDGGLRLEADQWAGIIATPLEAGLALFLIFGAKGVARLVHAARYGTKSSN